MAPSAAGDAGETAIQPATTAAAAPNPSQAETPAAKAGALEMHCIGEGVRLDLTKGSLVLSDNPRHAKDRRWNELSASYGFSAGAVVRSGTIAGHRNVDYGFLMSGSNQREKSGKSVVELTLTQGGRGNGAPPYSGHVAWTTGETEQFDGGEALDKTASRPVTCTGSLLTVAPSPR